MLPFSATRGISIKLWTKCLHWKSHFSLLNLIILPEVEWGRPVYRRSVGGYEIFFPKERKRKGKAKRVLWSLSKTYRKSCRAWGAELEWKIPEDVGPTRLHLLISPPSYMWGRVWADECKEVERRRQDLGQKFSILQKVHNITSGKRFTTSLVAAVSISMISKSIAQIPLSTLPPPPQPSTAWLSSPHKQIDSRDVLPSVNVHKSVVELELNFQAYLPPDF